MVVEFEIDERLIDDIREWCAFHDIATNFSVIWPVLGIRMSYQEWRERNRTSSADHYLGERRFFRVCVPTDEGAFLALRWGLIS